MNTTEPHGLGFNQSQDQRNVGGGTGGQGDRWTRRIRRPGGLGGQKGSGVQGPAELGVPEIGLTVWKNE